MHKHPTSWRSSLILSSHLRLGLAIGLFLSGFPTKILYTLPLYPKALNVPPISFFSIWSSEQYWVRSTTKIYQNGRLSSCLQASKDVQNLHIETPLCRWSNIRRMEEKKSFRIALTTLKIPIILYSRWNKLHYGNIKAGSEISSSGNKQRVLRWNI